MKEKEMLRGIANVVRDVAIRVVLNIADAVTSGSVVRVVEGAEAEREREREREEREEREEWDEWEEDEVEEEDREFVDAEDKEDDEVWEEEEGDEDEEGFGDEWPPNVEYYDGYVPGWVKPEWFRGTFFFKSDVIDYVSDIPVVVIVCRVDNVYYVYVPESDRNED